MSPDELPAFRAGDRDLFRRLVDEYSPRLLGTAMTYLSDSDEAHDAVQEVWLRAYERRGQLQSAGALPGWLFSICRNACLAEHRRSAIRGRDVTDASGAAPRPEPQPDEAVVAYELRRAVSDAIAELAPRQRDVVVLRIIEGRSTRETAHALGCAEGTVKAALHQSLQKLKPILGSWHHVVVS